MRAVASIAIALAPILALAQAPDRLAEIRYCGAPARAADGSIKRSSAVLAAFQRQHPCPATGKTTGACPSWQLNHVIPLACGGCDAVWNLDWMPVETKTCAQPWCRDRWERKAYAASPPVAETPACSNVIVTK